MAVVAVAVGGAVGLHLSFYHHHHHHHTLDTLDTPDTRSHQGRSLT